MPARLNRPPRLLVTTDAVGGVFTYALDLSNWMRRSGVDVTLALLGPQASDAQLAQMTAIGGLEVVRISGPLDWTAQEADELCPVAEALAHFARKSGADLLHLNSPVLAALADFGLPLLGVCHSCTASWWRAVRGGALPPDFAWRRKLLADGYAACDAVIAPTSAFAEVTREIYGADPAVVWNGRPPAAGGAKVESFVLSAGRLWDEAKGFATLDAAAAMIDAPVVALGGLAGPDGTWIRLEHVRTPGAQDAAAMSDWLARAPVFASAALYEPFGLTVLEAAQAGAALVLSDIATLRELWAGAAIFVPPRDARGFAAAINRVLADDSLRQALSAKAQVRAGRYTLEAMGAGILGHYTRLSAAAFAPPSTAAAA